MNIYYIVFFITFFIQLLPARNKKWYWIRTFLSFIPLFFYGAIRKDFGKDYAEYEVYFDMVHESMSFVNIVRPMELGYTALMMICPSYRFVLVLTTALTCLSYIYFIYKTIPPKYSWFAIILLFLGGDETIFFSLSGLRNGIAIAILLFSIDYIKERKIKPFAILTIIATLFHTSAVIFMPLAYIVGTNKPITGAEIKKWMSWLVIISVASFTILLVLLDTIVGQFFSRYEVYIDNIQQSIDKGGSVTGRFSLLAALLMAWCVLNLAPGIKKKMDDYYIIRITMLFFIGIIIAGFVMRMSHFYILFFIASTTKIVSYSRNSIKYPYLMMVFVFLAYSFFVLWMGSSYWSYEKFYSILD